MPDARFSDAQIGYRDKEKELESQGHLHEDRDHCKAGGGGWGGGEELNRTVWFTVGLAPSARRVRAARQKYISALSRTGHFYYLALAAGNVYL